MNYRRNRRYFMRFPAEGACLAVALSAASVGLGIWQVFTRVPLGAALIAAGAAGLIAVAVWIAVSYAGKPSDAQIDADCRALADYAAQDALDKAGLTDQMRLEVQPVVLSAGIFEKIRTDFRIAKGRDGKVRSSNFANFVLLFTLEQIVTCTSAYSLIAPEREDRIEEYYYDDIVTLTTTEKRYTEDGVQRRVETLCIVTSAGTTLNLPFEDNEAAREAILTIRRIIRAKKRFR